MKLESLTGSRRSSRRRHLAHVPRAAETFEQRTLLAAPQILSPTANSTLTTQPHTIEWSAVNNAVSYDLWVSDMDTQTVIFVENGIADTMFTPAEQLNQGRIRVWVRATLNDASQTPWSAPVDFFVQVTPTITGPLNLNQPAATQYKLDTPNPALEWISAPGSSSFDIFLNNVTAGTSKTYNVPGQVAVSTIEVALAPTDGSFRLILRTTPPNGAPRTASTEFLPADATAEQVQTAIRMLNGFSNTRVWSTITPANTLQYVIEYRNFENADSTIDLDVEDSTVGGLFLVQNGLSEENRWFQFPVADVGPLQQFKVYIRSIDDGGRVGNWSPAFGAPQRNISFETAPMVTGLIPSQQNPGFLQIFPEEDISPMLSWDAVPNATQYDLWFSRKNNNGTQTILYRQTNLTTNSFQIPKNLADGNYIFWVRALRKTATAQGGSVLGNWSDPAEFFIGQKTYVPQVSTLAIDGGPVSGTYRLSLLTSEAGFNPQKTDPLPFNANAAQVQAALRKLKSFANVTVNSTGGVPGWLHTITFNGINAPVSMSVVDDTTNATFKVQITRPVSAVMNGRTDITGPVGQFLNNTNVVTDIRPTIEWLPVDKAVRYEIWIDRKGSASPWLIDNSALSSYTLPMDIAAGEYTVWVRAFNTHGTVCKWSNPWLFTATGGKPIILSPADGAAVNNQPTITWTPVTAAASYEIWITYVGVDYDYYVKSDIPLAEHTVTSALPAGTFRIWVRAILADGTALAWSDSIAVTVALHEIPEADEFLLTGLQAPLNANSEQTESQEAIPAEADARTSPATSSPDTVPLSGSEHPSQQSSTDDATLSEESADSNGTTGTETDDMLTAETLSQLAEDCVQTEWWMVDPAPAGSPRF